MSCKRCPHYVRHGRAAADGKSIEFRDLCGLKLKKLEEDKKAFSDEVCVSLPFPEDFDHHFCSVYQHVFQSGIKRNGVNPRDMQYSENLTAGSITDMELL
ncbi:hypothetical protein N9D31_01125 [Oligoflexaceae bacterium]|nr:hypothetical protein [Oligoflexaceae bacterium]